MANAEIRDMREMFAWQSQGALRILYEEYKGVESRNLVSLYVALTLKASQRFDNVLVIQTKDLIEYTGLNKDWVPTGLRTLIGCGLIEVVTLRDDWGRYVGKQIVLLPAPKAPRANTGFLGAPIKKNNNTKAKAFVTAEEKNMISRDVWEQFKDILIYGVEVGAFGTRLPVDTGSDAPLEVTKEIKKIIGYLIQLSNGTFAHNHGLDIKINKDDYRYVVMEALDTFLTMKNDLSVWPHDKSSLPNQFSTWFVNPRSGYSWFARCLEGPVSNKEQYDRYKQQDADTATQDVTSERLNILLDWWRQYGFAINEGQKTTLRYNIQRVIEVHREIWDKYGQYYAKISNWMSYFGGKNPDLFLKRYLDYLTTFAGDPHHGKVSPDSQSFASFLTWIDNEYGFNLNMSEYERDKLIIKSQPRKVKEEDVMTYEEAMVSDELKHVFAYSWGESGSEVTPKKGEVSNE